ncbi:cbb3-type cytochrome c oxidase subunit I [Planctomycetota bacterium]|nr:cbb3-type cytochrome c oxidase subunit I [Planctomycetota bacterium]
MSATQPTQQTDIFGKPVDEQHKDNYLTHQRGLMSWLFTLDHKRIGIMYMIAVLSFFFVGGVFAIVLRVMLTMPIADASNQMRFEMNDTRNIVESSGATVPEEAIKLLYEPGVTDAEAQQQKIEVVLTDAASSAGAGAKVVEYPELINARDAAAQKYTQDLTNHNTFYNQSFTLHGAVMVFLFIIPAIPAIIGNFVLPLMLGAKDVAFPRLNLASWYCYMGGALFFLWVLGKGILNFLVPTLEGVWGGGGLDTGWTFYTPYSTETNTAVVAATAGAFVLGFSSILTAVNFIASIHMLRPKGMTWFRMPLMLWALYATAVIQILATPVLAITLLLLIAERAFGIGIFDPALGGDPILYQHFFWFYSHPAVYIMILPAMGIVSEVISVFSRKHIFGYAFIACSSMAIAILGFLVWGHHMFTSGQSELLNAVFSIITMLVAIPSAIKVFNWLTTMYNGSIRLDSPMLYALGFIWLFTIGGLTGIYCATLAVNIHIHDTYFIVAHFHYVMVGSTLFAFLAGMHYWWPKMFGKNYSERWARWGWLLVFVGFNITFFIQFIMGALGMPRRYATYIDKYTIYHHISTGGSLILTVGLFLVLFVWIHSLLKGKQSPANPWGANSLEWHTISPPPHANFDHAPPATDPYDYSHWRWRPEIAGYVLNEDSEPEEKDAMARNDS